MTDERRELVEDVFEWMRTVKAASDADEMPTSAIHPEVKRMQVMSSVG